MRLEDYFDFLAPDDIRIRGHRIGIESVLYEYLYRARTPEEIAERFDTLTLDQVYATILYYLRSATRSISTWPVGWSPASRRAESRTATQTSNGCASACSRFALTDSPAKPQAVPCRGDSALLLFDEHIDRALATALRRRGLGGTCRVSSCSTRAWASGRRQMSCLMPRTPQLEEEHRDQIRYLPLV
jgi:uncharacterized protein (DUF433 family)